MGPANGFVRFIMRTRLPAQFLIAPATLYLLVGCATPYRSRDVGVTVRDAETHEPIPNAVVHVSHHHLADDAVSEKTDGSGIARVSFKPASDESTMIEASALGHMTEFQVVGDTTIANIPPAPIFGSAENRAADFVVELYAEPAFGIELVVPQGYRGLLKVDLNFRDDAPVPKGQRVFTFEASANGQVKGTGPGLLRRVPASSYSARYAVGTPIGDKMDDTQVGIRWLKREEGAEVFVVGTKPDFDQYRKDAGLNNGSMQPASDSGTRGGGRGGRGGGRGGRGGGGGGGS
jgi:hypothetical protein